MRRIQRWIKPAIMVIAGVFAIATVCASVPATAHARTPAAGAQAHARFHSGAQAHARAPYELA